MSSVLCFCPSTFSTTAIQSPIATSLVTFKSPYSLSSSISRQIHRNIRSNLTFYSVSNNSFLPPGNNNNNNNNNNSNNNNHHHGDGDFHEVPLLVSAAAIFEVHGASRSEYSEVEGSDNMSKLTSRRDQSNKQNRIVEELLLFFLPEGFPASVGDSYLQYSFWRGCQNLISAMTAVLSTHALLKAVGFRGAGIAAATNWVLKDGIGQIGKLITARMGYQYDADPKFWRLFSDILFDAGLSMEILTPLVPQYFLVFAALGNFIKSVSVTIGQASRNSVLTTFVRRENLGEISAKNDAQNVVTNLTGTALGIATAAALPNKPSAHLTAFLMLTAVYSVFNWACMKAVELQTLNRQRLSLALDEFVRKQSVPPPSVLNKREVIVPFRRKHLDEPAVSLGVDLDTLSCGSMSKLQSLCARFKSERYMLNIDTKHKYAILITLNEQYQQMDLLQAMLHVAYIRRELSELVVSGAGSTKETKTGKKDDIDCKKVDSWTPQYRRVCAPTPSRIKSVVSDAQIDHLIQKGLAFSKKNVRKVLSQLDQQQYHTKTLLLAPDRVRASW